MKRRKSLIVMSLLATALVLPSAMPSTAACDEPQAADVKAKPATEKATPESVSAGGKTLSQWRAIFGASTQKQGDGMIFLQPASDTTSAKAIKKKNTQILRNFTYQTLLPPQPKERQTPQRIIRDAQKVYRTRLAIIANNLANADTLAYKRNRTLLEGTDHRGAMEGNDYSTQGQLAVAGISTSGGGPVLAVQTDFRQGRLEKTGRMLDIAIDGKGFFQVMNQQTGEIHYTRAGNLSVNCNGELTVGSTEKGQPIEPEITIPQDATTVSFNPDGTVTVKQPGSTQMTAVGRLMLAHFINPQGLQRLGGKLFAETEAAGKLFIANPGQESFGVIRQGHLECSNVSPSRELADWNAAAKRIKTLGRALPK